MNEPGNVRFNEKGFPVAIIPKVSDEYTISARTPDQYQYPIQAIYMGIGVYSALSDWGFKIPGVERAHTFMRIDKNGDIETYTGPVGPRLGELKIVWMDADEDTTGWPAPQAHLLGKLPFGPVHDFARQRLETLVKEQSQRAS